MDIEKFQEDLSNYDIETSEFNILDFKYQQVKDTNILLVLNHDSKESSYNVNQSLTAFDAGYHCIHVFDWDDSEKLIKYLNIERTIDIKDCIMCGITRDYAEIFYSENSLCSSYSNNGFQKDAVYYGIYYKREIIFVFGILNVDLHHYVVCMCCKLGTTVKNLDEIFKTIKEFNVICDISKSDLFYLIGIGLKYVSVIEPTVHWVRQEKDVVSRYDCGKIILNGDYN